MIKRIIICFSEKKLKRRASIDLYILVFLTVSWDDGASSSCLEQVHHSMRMKTYHIRHPLQVEEEMCVSIQLHITWRLRRWQYSCQVIIRHNKCQVIGISTCAVSGFKKGIPFIYIYIMQYNNFNEDTIHHVWYHVFFLNVCTDREIDKTWSNTWSAIQTKKKILKDSIETCLVQ